MVGEVVGEVLGMDFEVLDQPVLMVGWGIDSTVAGVVSSPVDRHSNTFSLFALRLSRTDSKDVDGSETELARRRIR
jgi:hypothetical protein